MSNGEGMRGWRRSAVCAIGFGAFGLVACSSGEPEWSDHVLEEAIGTADMALQSTQIVYVNFGGGRIDDCSSYCSDASTNRSWAIGEVWKTSFVTFLPYGGSSAARDTILATLRQAYAPYNVEFVTKRPAAAPYSMIMISASGGPHHGVAPLNCANTNPNDIAFVYRANETSAGFTARAAVHELGHSFGLAHVTSSADFMHWDSSGSTFTASAYDTGHPSGKCFDGSTQDASALLRAALGDKIVAPVPFDGVFADDDGNVHEAAIEAVARAGITVGCAGGDRPRYCPNDVVTRGQMAVFLARAFKLPAASTNYFDDDDGAWYESAANAVALAGITVGCGPRSYCGSDPVTREQMATFLSRAMSWPASGVDAFTDDDGSVHEANINRIAAVGVTKGCGPGRFCPDEPVRRDQMASFLARALALP